MQNPRKRCKPARGGKRNSAGRSKGAHDTAPRLPRAAWAPSKNKYAFVEYALQHASKALDVLVDIMNNSESDVARASAAKKILNRALGKAPKHIDPTAIKHTEIVYRSVDEIRQEIARLRAATGGGRLTRHGVP